MTSAATSAWWFVTLKVEWSGGRGALNLMPVKGLIVISGNTASSEHPSADHTHSSSLHDLYFPYASHRRWRFLLTEKIHDDTNAIRIDVR